MGTLKTLWHGVCLAIWGVFGGGGGGISIAMSLASKGRPRVLNNPCVMVGGESVVGVNG